MRPTWNSMAAASSLFLVHSSALASASSISCFLVIVILAEHTRTHHIDACVAVVAQPHGFAVGELHNVLVAAHAVALATAHLAAVGEQTPHRREYIHSVFSPGSLSSGTPSRSMPASRASTTILAMRSDAPSRCCSILIAVSNTMSRFSVGMLRPSSLYCWYS